MDKKTSRIRRARRTRSRIKEQGVHRLSIHRTPRHIYAQVIAPSGSEVVAAASTLDPKVRAEVAYGGNAEAAKVVGKMIAERSIEAGVQSVAFDRSGFRFHGRIKALADAARESGLKV